MGISKAISDQLIFSRIESWEFSVNIKRMFRLNVSMYLMKSSHSLLEQVAVKSVSGIQQVLKQYWKDQRKQEREQRRQKRTKNLENVARRNFLVVLKVILQMILSSKRNCIRLMKREKATKTKKVKMTKNRILMRRVRRILIH